MASFSTPSSIRRTPCEQETDLRTTHGADRRELNGLYKTYFAAYGHPYPGEPRKRIDPDDERFMGVLRFTDAAFQRWLDARELTTKLKRKLRGLVERLGRAQ